MPSVFWVCYKGSFGSFCWAWWGGTLHLRTRAARPALRLRLPLQLGVFCYSNTDYDNMPVQGFPTFFCVINAYGIDQISLRFPDTVRSSFATHCCCYKVLLRNTNCDNHGLNSLET
ncbi:hypothetical protein STEG23_030962, partial [Scotinomys teguina]